ncbi:DUF1801 domain-containing protein [Halobacillus sp. ACCC02827]|uniref:DUF1801 domain-containing protein n=1 Tax=Bacillaceae TaxID=186817 RepID=UPI0002A4D877|nr:MULTISPECIES: DUF1801 domain-containing protein [Bacillaceae]ELK46505.1 hypothetical protein D479_10241 [Halobacillus sp. BAB-2008]QHT46140.1 DUF1801 domain-containing protein [Bacillus sp. SB49]WJE16954.1 DUF1801 domain-containing protein [Halobacillus sp. ACCC02827]
MAYEQKTKPTEMDVDSFIDSVEQPRKREDARELVKIFEETTGYEARMWGASIIGFGTYHYKYPTGHEGDAPLVGFSPRKANISLYFATGDPDRSARLADLGKHKTGKACVYINKLADVDTLVLKKLIRQSVAFLQKTYPE